jgi:SAM-dependent methyltransferase
VTWVLGDAASIPPIQADIAFMTANVAQVFLTDDEWMSTLRALHRALRPGGRLVFESRDPARMAWLQWGRDESHRWTEIPGTGAVEAWSEVTEVAGDLVSFRWTYVFPSDGAVITSDSTLRFRGRDELAFSLQRTGFTVDEVRDAPDRPGREFVFIASR